MPACLPASHYTLKSICKFSNVMCLVTVLFIFVPWSKVSNVIQKFVRTYVRTKTKSYVQKFEYFSYAHVRIIFWLSPLPMIHTIYLGLSICDGSLFIVHSISIRERWFVYSPPPLQLFQSVQFYFCKMPSISEISLITLIFNKIDN